MNEEYSIITGASSGIGLEFANQLANRGQNIVLVARRKNELEEISKNIIEKYKVKTIILVCDLSKIQEIRRAEKEIAKLKKIDFLVNCAGFGNKVMYSEMDSQKIEDMIQVHVMATTILTRAILPEMIKRNTGHIINISSIASFITSSKSNAIYNSTKAYERTFTENIIDELKLKAPRVHAQALCPGLTRTPFFKNYDASYAPKFMWMDAREVVTKSIKQVIKKSTVFIPGWKNKFIVLLLKGALTKKIINYFGRRLNIK